MKEERDRSDEMHILTRVRAGDNAALGKLYKAHFPSVMSYVHAHGGDDDDAEEVYQQAFIILYEKLQDPGFTLSASSGTFLYAVARNLWLASLKDRRRYTAEVADPPQEESGDMIQILEKEKEFERLETSMQLIGEPCKSILKAYYSDMLSMEEIAEQFGYTNADNAKNQKYKCLMRLKRYFEKI
jgi:RNA polymerase sigma factor (sigma-70 family)